MKDTEMTDIFNVSAVGYGNQGNFIFSFPPSPSQTHYFVIHSPSQTFSQHTIIEFHLWLVEFSSQCKPLDRLPLPFPFTEFFRENRFWSFSSFFPRYILKNVTISPLSCLLIKTDQIYIWSRAFFTVGKSYFFSTKSLKYSQFLELYPMRI